MRLFPHPWTLILKPPRSSAVSNCPTTELIGESCGLSARYLAEELRRPFGSKDFVVLEIAVFCLDVWLVYIDGFTETMFKATTDGILLLMFAWWNR